jgi:EpsI family protein
VTIAFYRNQRQGAELIHVGNKLEPTETWEWRKSRAVDLGRSDYPPMRAEHYGKGASSSIVYVVYWVAGFTTASDATSKGLQVVARLLGRGDDAAAIVITASDQEGGAAAEARAETFLRERLPRLLDDLDLASKSSN